MKNYLENQKPSISPEEILKKLDKIELDIKKICQPEREEVASSVESPIQTPTLRVGTAAQQSQEEPKSRNYSQVN